MKIAFFGMHDWEETIIKENFKDHTLYFSKDPLNENNVYDIEDFEIVSIFLYSKIDSKILDVLHNLKLVATRSTGYDHIDIEECKKRGIKVCNVPSYGENTVAEHAFALILSISRRIIESVERTRGQYFSCEGLTGFDLKDKTLGVIGTGNIGKHVIRIAKGFEMKIIAFDAFPNENLKKELGFEYVALDKLLAESDIVTLHAPYLPSTHHMINKNNIKTMKKGAVLINTARGGLIETEALFDALENGPLSYAGLDVLEDEKEITEERQLLCKEYTKTIDYKRVLENHILMDLPNVVMTPHNAFNSKEALRRIIDTDVNNIKGFIIGNIVNCVIK